MLQLNEQPQLNSKRNYKLVLSALASTAVVGAATTLLLSNGQNAKVDNTKFLDMFPDEFSMDLKVKRYNKYNNMQSDDLYHGRLNKWNDEAGDWTVEGELLWENNWRGWKTVTYLKDEEYYVISNKTLSCYPQVMQPGYALAKNVLLNAIELPDNAELDDDMSKRLLQFCKEDSVKAIMESEDYGHMVICMQKKTDGVHGKVFTREMTASFVTSEGNKYVIEVPKERTDVDGVNLSDAKTCPKGNKFESTKTYTENFNKKEINHVNHKFAAPVDNFPFKDPIAMILELKQNRRLKGEEMTSSVEGGDGRKGEGQRRPIKPKPDPAPVGFGAQVDPLNEDYSVYNPNNEHAPESPPPPPPPPGALDQDCKNPPCGGGVNTHNAGPGIALAHDDNQDHFNGWDMGCYWFHGAGNHKGYRKQPAKKNPYGNGHAWKKETYDHTLVGTTNKNTHPDNSANPHYDGSNIPDTADFIENVTEVRHYTDTIDYLDILGQHDYDKILQVRGGDDFERWTYEGPMVDIVQKGTRNKGFEADVRMHMDEFNGSSCHLRMYDFKKDRYYTCLEAFYQYMIIGGADHEGGVMGQQCGEGHFYFGNTATRYNDTHDMKLEVATYLCGNQWCYFGQHYYKPEVVFTHSYGGNCTMSAFASGHVKKGDYATIAMNQPPLKGSPGAEYVHMHCTQGDWGLAQIMDNTYQKVIKRIGYCITSPQGDKHAHQTNGTWRYGLRFQPMPYETAWHPEGLDAWEEDYFIDYKYCGTYPCGMVTCFNIPGAIGMGTWMGDGDVFNMRSAGGLFACSRGQCSHYEKCYEMKCKHNGWYCNYRGCNWSFPGSQNDCESHNGNQYKDHQFVFLNDGMVNISSCQGKSHEWYHNTGPTDNSTWWGGQGLGLDTENAGSGGNLGVDQGSSYITVEATNHEDGTGVNGNSMTNGRQPINWYTLVIREIFLNDHDEFEGDGLYCTKFMLSNLAECSTTNDSDKTLKRDYSSEDGFKGYANYWYTRDVIGEDEDGFNIYETTWYNDVADVFGAGAGDSW